MRIHEIILLLILVVGIVLVLVFGIKTEKQTATVATAVEDQESAPVDADTPNTAGTASAYIDFSTPGEYKLADFELTTTQDSLSVADLEGDEIARFKLNSNGNLIPDAKQPAGMEVRNAWIGPPSTTDSRYHIYKSVDDQGDLQPVLGLLYESGNVTITPGEELKRTHAKSVRDDEVQRYVGE